MAPSIETATATAAPAGQHGVYGNYSKIMSMSSPSKRKRSHHHPSTWGHPYYPPAGPMRGPAVAHQSSSYWSGYSSRRGPYYPYGYPAHPVQPPRRSPRRAYKGQQYSYGNYGAPYYNTQYQGYAKADNSRTETQKPSEGVKSSAPGRNVDEKDVIASLLLLGGAAAGSSDEKQPPKTDDPTTKTASVTPESESTSTSESGEGNAEPFVPSAVSSGSTEESLSIEVSSSNNPSVIALTVDENAAPQIQPCAQADKLNEGVSPTGDAWKSNTAVDQDKAGDLKIDASFSMNPSIEEIKDCRTPRARAALYSWYCNLTQLYRFRENHGHCNVPQKQGTLGAWVNKQRMEYKALREGKKSSLTDRKLEELKKVGFCYARPKGKPSWDIRYGELTEFYKKYGHSNVPTKFSRNPALGRWVSTQRSQYKKFNNGIVSQLTDEHIAKLEKLDFQWTMTDSFYMYGENNMGSLTQLLRLRVENALKANGKADGAKPTTAVSDPCASVGKESPSKRQKLDRADGSQSDNRQGGYDENSVFVLQPVADKVSSEGLVHLPPSVNGDKIACL